jgi:hypothetical protein
MWASSTMTKRAPLIAAILLLLLPLLYLGSYLALVTPGPRIGWGSARYSNYRAADEFCIRFFWPLEQIDRQLRPNAWSWPFIDEEIILFPPLDLAPAPPASPSNDVP